MKKPGAIQCVAVIFMMFFAGCSLESKSNARKLIKVYANDSFGKAIANINVTDKGELTLSIVQPEPTGSVSVLKTVFDEIQLQKFLELPTEEKSVIHGQSVIALKREKISPGDPRYIWAVAHALAKYGFEYHIPSNTSE